MFIDSFRRLFTMLVTLFLLAGFTFFLVRLAPGGPFDSDQAWPPEVQQAILHQYQLDRPVTTQFVHWLSDVVQGNWGESFQYLGRPVIQVIGESFPISFSLGLGAFLLAALCGITLGVFSAWNKNQWLSQGILFINFTLISLPSYFIAAVLILVFALKLGWFPSALWEQPSSCILPLLTLAARPMAILSRMTRNSVLEVLETDYIRTAVGKGLPRTQVLFKHALKNALLPVVTLLGPIAAQLVTGSFLVEVIFQIPGMSKYFIQAVLNRDYPLVMGVTLVYGAILIFCNALVDFTYTWIDPRIRNGAIHEV